MPCLCAILPLTMIHIIAIEVRVDLAFHRTMVCDLCRTGRVPGCPVCLEEAAETRGHPLQSAAGKPGTARREPEGPRTAVPAAGRDRARRGAGPPQGNSIRQRALPSAAQLECGGSRRQAVDRFRGTG